MEDDDWDDADFDFDDVGLNDADGDLDGVDFDDGDLDDSSTFSEDDDEDLLADAMEPNGLTSIMTQKNPSEHKLNG